MMELGPVIEKMHKSRIYRNFRSFLRMNDSLGLTRLYRQSNLGEDGKMAVNLLKLGPDQNGTLKYPGLIN